MNKNNTNESFLLQYPNEEIELTPDVKKSMLMGELKLGAIVQLREAKNVFLQNLPNTISMVTLLTHDGIIENVTICDEAKKSLINGLIKNKDLVMIEDGEIHNESLSQVILITKWRKVEGELSEEYMESRLNELIGNARTIPIANIADKQITIKNLQNAMRELGSEVIVSTRNSDINIKCENVKSVENGNNNVNSDNIASGSSNINRITNNQAPKPSALNRKYKKFLEDRNTRATEENYDSSKLIKFAKSLNEKLLMLNINSIQQVNPSITKVTINEMKLNCEGTKMIMGIILSTSKITVTRLILRDQEKGTIEIKLPNQNASPIIKELKRGSIIGVLFKNSNIKSYQDEASDAENEIRKIFTTTNFIELTSPSDILRDNNLENYKFVKLLSSDVEMRVEKAYELCKNMRTGTVIGSLVGVCSTPFPDVARYNLYLRDGNVTSESAYIKTMKIHIGNDWIGGSPYTLKNNEILEITSLKIEKIIHEKSQVVFNSTPFSTITVLSNI